MTQPRTTRVLALDTSTIPCCGFFSLDADTLPREAEVVAFDEPRDLSSRLINLVDDALQAGSATLDDVDVLAVGLGPGSWTGLRIGVSAFKTLAQTRELPLVGIKTFDAMRTTQLGKDVDGSSLAAITSSRPGEIYASSGLQNARAIAITSTELYQPDEFAQQLVEDARPVILLTFPEASSLAAREEVAVRLRALNCEPALETVWPAQLLSALAQIAARRFARGKANDPLRLEPLYLAPSNAERVRNAKLAAQSSS